MEAYRTLCEAPRLLGPIKHLEIVMFFRLLSYRSLHRSLRWRSEAEYLRNFNEVCPHPRDGRRRVFPTRAVVGSGRPRDATGGHAAMGAGLFAGN
jgi:hypothetical protein